MQGYLKVLRRDDMLYTPIDDRVVRTLWDLHKEWGTWRNVVEATGVRKRMLWRIRNREYKSVSIVLWDRILTLGGSALRVDDFPWFDVDGMQECGVWMSKEEFIRRGYQYVLVKKAA